MICGGGHAPPTPGGRRGTNISKRDFQKLACLVYLFKALTRRKYGRRVGVQVERQGAVVSDILKCLHDGRQIHLSLPGSIVKFRGDLVGVGKMDVPNPPPKAVNGSHVVFWLPYPVVATIVEDAKVRRVQRVAQIDEKLIVHADGEGMRFDDEPSVVRFRKLDH